MLNCFYLEVFHTALVMHWPQNLYPLHMFVLYVLSPCRNKLLSTS